KNTCNLPSIIKIPTILDDNGNPTAPNNYMEKHVIEPYYARLAQRRAAGQDYNDLINELENQILLITDEVSANDFVSRIDEFDHIGNSKLAAGKMLAKRAKELNISYSKESGRYEAPAQRNENRTFQNSLL